MTSKRGRWLTWSGLALVLAGVLVLGYVGWQYVGTNWVSHRTQARVITQIERGWQRGEGPAPPGWGCT